MVPQRTTTTTGLLLGADHVNDLFARNVSGQKAATHRTAQAPHLVRDAEILDGVAADVHLVDFPELVTVLPQPKPG